MPELIGEDKGVANIVTHRDCGAIIRYYECERLKEYQKDWDGSGDLYYLIVCPKCSQKVYVP